jgi:hypothetical protein
VATASTPCETTGIEVAIAVASAKEQNHFARTKNFIRIRVATIVDSLQQLFGVVEDEKVLS